jgi:nuclear pore complex protein Nup85
VSRHTSNRVPLLKFFCHSDVVEQIFDVIPYDPTELEDVIHAQLLTGKVTKVLASAEKLDVWLSCHLADVTNALGLLNGAEGGEE